MNIKTRGNLIYGYKSTFTGNFLSFQNNYNIEENGGAIYIISSNLKLNNSLISNNYANNGAGLNAQLNYGTTMKSNLENVIFENNKGKVGAGIKNTGEITLNKCEIKNCYASNYGGGISNEGGGVAYLSDVKINKNIADNMGGGLFIDGFTNLNNVIITGNYANSGGGIVYSGGNDKRTLNVEKGTVINNNIALKDAGGIYVQNGIVHLNGGEIYDNIINADEKIGTSNSDLFYISKGKVNINSIKLSGSMFKDDLGTIYLKTNLLKYDENSKIYIDFPNNEISKNLIIPSNYDITLEDLNKISLIDSNSGQLEISSNNIIFSARKLNITFNTKNTSEINNSFAEPFLTEKNYYYGQSLTLSQSLFPVKDNEYVVKIFDQQGNNYKLGETIKITKDIEFDYLISYKNKIIFDFSDYMEEKLIIPDDYLFLPSFRKDYSREKEILYWKDFNNQEFGISEKILGNKNKTFVAIFTNNGDNFMVKIYAYGINYYSSLLKYKENIQLPQIIVPKNNHFICWMDLYSNKQYDSNITDILVIKDYYLIAIIIGYVNYYISDELKIQKSYNINSYFIILNQTNFPNYKILHWKDKITGAIYEFHKEYKLEGDLDLLAVLENKQNKEDDNDNGNNTGLIVALCFVGIFIIFVIICLIHRYKKFKAWKDVKSKVFENNKDNKLEKILE